MPSCHNILHTHRAGYRFNTSATRSLNKIQTLLGPESLDKNIYSSCLQAGSWIQVLLEWLDIALLCRLDTRATRMVRYSSSDQAEYKSYLLQNGQIYSSSSVQARYKSYQNGQIQLFWVGWIQVLLEWLDTALLCRLDTSATIIVRYSSCFHVYKQYQNGRKV